MGLEIFITQENIAQLIGAENRGMVIINKKDGGDYAREIKKALFEKKDDYGKVKNMHLK